ncbi:hypothetical protein RUM44_000416 [Polyplax serrata]|uniref:Adenylate kinase 7 n=1 Tax=Polyplax serrata TaxID=468196 RepID=A0ABR1B5C8_POLSC
MHGPPASGKTFLAKRLASYYDVPHLHVKGIIDETIQSLKDKIQAIREKNAKAEEKERLESEKVKIEGDEEGNEEDEDEEEDEEGDDIDVLNDNLREIEENMDNENNRLDEEFVIKFFKEKMLSNVCQNKGYIIDGYPKTMEATKLLYEPEGEIEMEADTEGQGTVTQLYNTAIMPDFVESLDASDEFLIERVIKMPEIDVQNTHYEEREMCRRLTHFRALNTEDNTPLVFYDECEVHPMIYNVEEDLDPNMNPTFQAIVSVIGPPKNYGDTSDELLKIIKQKRDAEEQKEYEDMKAQKEDIKKAAQERRDDLQQWMFLKNQELEMEEKALLVMGMPLRHYLMKYIFPTLTRGLVEVARLRPNDPIDFLSEFLFQENPEGKMFQPNFEEREEKLEMAIKEYENSLKNPPSRMSSVRTFSTEKSVHSGVISKVSSYKCSRVPSSASKKSLQSQSSKKSNKSESMGICTCGQKSPSLSTCSSDVTPSTPASCTCTFDQSSSCETPEEVDPCKCPC